MASIEVVLNFISIYTTLIILYMYVELFKLTITV